MWPRRRCATRLQPSTARALELDRRQVERRRLAHRGQRDREVLDREPRRVEKRDLVLAGPSGRVSGEHVAELGDVVPSKHARRDCRGKLAAVARLFLVVAEDPGPGQLLDGHLGLTRAVGAHEGHVLAGTQRP